MLVETSRGRGTTIVEYKLPSVGCVSSLESVPFEMWFGGEQIRVAGLASVYTQPECRLRGYARACIEYARELQESRSCVGSLLFGNRQLYERFGYARVMRWYAVNWNIESLEGVRATSKSRLVTQEDMPVLLQLYRCVASKRTGSMVRGYEKAELQNPVPWCRDVERCVLLDDVGNIAAYVCHSVEGADRLEVAEVLAINPTWYRHLANYLVLKARDRGCEQVSVAVPPDEPFVKWLMGGEVDFVTGAHASGGMFCVYDWQNLCSVLTGVLRNRVVMLRPERVPRLLRLIVNGEQNVIHLNGRDADVIIEATSRIMIQLLFGYYGSGEALAAGAQGSWLESPAAAHMFPQQHPFMYLTDRF